MIMVQRRSGCVMLNAFAARTKHAAFTHSAQPRRRAALRVCPNDRNAG
jgi:hypothetical protein